MKRDKTFEEALEDNPLRPIVRDRMEILPLARAVRAAGAGRIGEALQVACARGDSTAQLLRRFPIDRLTAVDRSESMIALAAARHAALGARFMAMDIPRLEFPAASFDAVFNLAELHNYADWRAGLAEMARVLKPGGLLVMDELCSESFSRGLGPYFRRRTVHPYEAMFSAAELRDALPAHGLEVLRFSVRKPLGLLGYLIVVARKR